MRKLIFFLLLFPLAAVALINGNLLEGSPDVVRIVFSNGWMCSGTYIDPYTILTAAHCLIADEEHEKLEVKEVLSEADFPLNVHQVALIPSPLFAHQSWPAYDIGVVKTSKNVRFTGQFRLSRHLEAIRGSAILFGAGKTEATNDERQRAYGTNAFTRIGSVLFFFGASSTGKSDRGINVSVAPNDSGGPVIGLDTKEIIGVLTTTTAKTSAQYGLPALSTATSTASKENGEFIMNHLGQQER